MHRPPAEEATSHAFLGKWRQGLAAARVSFSTFILLAVLGSSLVMVSIVVWRTQAGSDDAGEEIAVRMLSLAGDHISLETDYFSLPIVQLRENLSAMPQATSKHNGFEHPMRNTFLEALQDIPHLYSLYLAFPDGGFYQGISLRNRPGLYQELKAPPEAMYGIRHISIIKGVPMQAWRFYDERKNVIRETELVKSTYDPRTRDWYKGAVAASGDFRTEPYVFTSLKNMGLTMSRYIPGQEPVVLALGVTLKSLSDFVADQRMGKASLVQIFTSSGKLVAYPDATKLLRKEVNAEGKEGLVTVHGKDVGDPLAAAMLKSFESGGGKALPAHEISVNGARYLTQIMPIRLLGADREFVGLAVPTTEFIGPLERAQREGLILVGLLSLAVITATIFAARTFARPLKHLTSEAARLSELDMAATPSMTSHIAEIDTLCCAMSVMRANFQVFGRYLPRSLMRNLHGGHLAHLGGQRREITLLFTDVEDFTVMSEKLDPMELMQMMSEYFQGVTEAILTSDGTLDKFIGDAVMAFWNAPNPNDKHIELACVAALRLQKATDELNARRESQGLPPMRTRVGIHTGEAVVGNIGTDERMDYTALGAAVNLASRLEALNKYYGTRILVSKRVRDGASGSFMFRSSDVVAPKGVAEAQVTFELVGAKPKSDYPDVAVPSKMLGFCSRWERAMTLYRTKEWARALDEFTALADLLPEDQLAKRYVRRVQRLLEGGQEDGWKAAVHFTEK